MCCRQGAIEAREPCHARSRSEGMRLASLKRLASWRRASLLRMWGCQSGPSSGRCRPHHHLEGVQCPFGPQLIIKQRCRDRRRLRGCNADDPIALHPIASRRFSTMRQPDRAGHRARRWGVATKASRAAHLVFQLFLAGLLFAFGDFLEFGIKTRQRGGRSGESLEMRLS